MNELGDEASNAPSGVYQSFKSIALDFIINGINGKMIHSPPSTLPKCKGRASGRCLKIQKGIRFTFSLLLVAHSSLDGDTSHLLSLCVITRHQSFEVRKKFLPETVMTPRGWPLRKLKRRRFRLFNLAGLDALGLDVNFFKSGDSHSKFDDGLPSWKAYGAPRVMLDFAYQIGHN